MYTCQQALINHLSVHFPTSQVKEIEAYAGQLRDNARKVTNALPCVLVMYIDGRPAAQEKFHQMDLLVVTESQVLDKVTHKNANMALSSEVIDYLADRHLFTAPGLSGTYEISREQMDARTILITDRFTIIAISLYIYDRRKRT
jgi:hypothetical protein